MCGVTRRVDSVIIDASAFHMKSHSNPDIPYRYSAVRRRLCKFDVFTNRRQAKRQFPRSGACSQPPNAAGRVAISSCSSAAADFAQLIGVENNSQTRRHSAPPANFVRRSTASYKAWRSPSRRQVLSKLYEYASDIVTYPLIKTSHISAPPPFRRDERASAKANLRICQIRSKQRCAFCAICLKQWE